MLSAAGSILRAVPGLIPLFDESPTVTPLVTPTPVVEPATVPVTPAPLASLWAPGQWLHKAGWSAEFHTPFLALFLVIAIAAVVVYFYFFQRRFKNHSLHAHLAQRLSMILTAFAAAGLLFLVFARLAAPLLSLPIWLLLSAVAFIAFVVYCFYYYSIAYPAALAKYNREQEKARYLPKSKGKGPALTPPMKKKQQQKKKRK